MKNLSREEAAERAALLRVESYGVRLDLTAAPSAARFGTGTRIVFECLADGADTFVEHDVPVWESAVLDGVPLDLGAVAGNRLPLRGLSAGRHELEVRAVADYSVTGEGLHRAVDPVDGEVYLYQQSFLDDAQRTFACFDQPDLKAPITLSVQAPGGWLVGANTRATQEGATWSFAPTEPVSTYLFTLAAGRYHVERSRHGTIELGLWCRQSMREHLDADDLFTVTRQSFELQERLFGRPYPFGDTYDQVFVPGFNAGAMENAGMITFTDDFLFRSKLTLDRRQPRRAAQLRRDQLREGRLGAAPAHGVRGPGRVLRRRAVLPGPARAGQHDAGRPARRAGGEQRAGIAGLGRRVAADHRGEHAAAGMGRRRAGGRAGVADPADRADRRRSVGPGRRGAAPARPHRGGRGPGDDAGAAVRAATGAAAAQRRRPRVREGPLRRAVRADPGQPPAHDRRRPEPGAVLGGAVGFHPGRGAAGLGVRGGRAGRGRGRGRPRAGADDAGPGDHGGHPVRAGRVAAGAAAPAGRRVVGVGRGGQAGQRSAARVRQGVPRRCRRRPGRPPPGPGPGTGLAGARGRRRPGRWRVPGRPDGGRTGRRRRDRRWRVLG